MAGVAELDGLPPKTAIARHRFPTLAGVAEYTPLAAKTRHLPPSPARDLVEWRVLAGNGGLHAIARQNMPIAAIVRPCPPKHTNNRRFHVLVAHIMNQGLINCCFKYMSSHHNTSNVSCKYNIFTRHI